MCARPYGPPPTPLAGFGLLLLIAVFRIVTEKEEEEPEAKEGEGGLLDDGVSNTSSVRLPLSK